MTAATDPTTRMARAAKIMRLRFCLAARSAIMRWYSSMPPPPAAIPGPPTRPPPLPPPGAFGRDPPAARGVPHLEQCAKPSKLLCLHLGHATMSTSVGGTDLLPRGRARPVQIRADQPFELWRAKVAQERR